MVTEGISGGGRKQGVCSPVTAV